MHRRRKHEQDGIDRCSGRAGRDVQKRRRGVTATIDVISEALRQGEKVQLVGFGSFEVKVRAERMGRNPQTKEPIPIPASKAPVFKAGKALKDAVAR